MTNANLPGHTADRYGRDPHPSRRGRRAAIAVLGCLVVVAGLGVAYAGWRRLGPGEIQPQQLGYQVIDDNTITLHYTLTRTDPHRQVTCLLRAMDQNFTEVGRTTTTIPPSPNKTLEVTTPIPTHTRAASAGIDTCTHQPQ